KGFDVFVKALSVLDRNGFDFKAVIGGSGPELDAVKNLAIKLGVIHKIEFRGWIQKKEEFFNDIDIFCLPSLHEPFGIILLEAFMYGKPVVSSASEGPSEIIEHEKDGLLAEPGSPDALASGLIKCIENPNIANQLALNGYHKVSSQYSMDKVGKDLSEILSNIVDRDRAQKRATMLQY
ncbi:MAG: glycosyltransferase family 4 protein, partial [Rickettsiales bacterium]|nr:glycosyltransferase family 4 protein [Rickettsiales bacterium]